MFKIHKGRFVMDFFSIEVEDAQYTFVSHRRRFFLRCRLHATSNKPRCRPETAWADEAIALLEANE
jgi:hypothetical protein